MEHIEEKILQYDRLSPEERRLVDEHLEAHPELASLREEIVALEEHFREAARFSRHPVDEEVLAYYAASRSMQDRLPPEPLRTAFARIEASLAADPALQERYRAFERRLEELNRAGDPAAQFERLTGHVLPEPAAESSPAGAPGPSARLSAPERSARIFYLPRAARWAAAAVLSLCALYGLLLLASYASLSELERLAALDPRELQVEGYDLRLRSGAPPAADPETDDARYLRALMLLREARHTTLGLFPRYDEALLGRADALLQSVVERGGQAPDSFLRLEALYLIGKISLARGDVPQARAAFREVVAREGLRAPEAAHILDALADRSAP